MIEIFDTDDDTTRPFHENDNVDSADSTTTNNDNVPHNEGQGKKVNIHIIS